MTELMRSADFNSSYRKRSNSAPHNQVVLPIKVWRTEEMQFHKNR